MPPAAASRPCVMPPGWSADDVEDLIVDTRAYGLLRQAAAEPLLDEVAELRERLAEEVIAAPPSGKATPSP